MTATEVLPVAPVSLRDLEIRHLAALSAVAREGSFGRAAAALGYTQSAISQQIAALERIAGLPVFDRPGGPRPVELTPAGRLLLDHADAVLARIGLAERTLADFKAGIDGVLSIGTFQSVSVRVLPEVLRRFRSERPNVTVRLTDADDWGPLLEGLRDRRHDVIFVEETAVVGEDVVFTPLCHDPFVVMSPLGADLAGPGAAVRIADLDGVTALSQNNLACQRLVDDTLRDLGVDLHVVFRTDDNAAVQAMVRAGVGHAVMPALAVDLEDARVLVRRLEPEIPPRSIGIAVAANRTVAPAAARFIEIARDVCTAMDPVAALDAPARSREEIPA